MRFRIRCVVRLGKVLFSTRVFSGNTRPSRVTSRVHSFIQIGVGRICVIRHRRLGLLAPRNRRFMRDLALRVLKV